MQNLTETSEVMLTTVDNPFNPFTNFDEWFQFDTTKGYNSCGLLARISRTSNSLSEEEYEREVNRAIDEIIKYDPLNIYRRVYPPGVSQIN